MIKRLMLAIAFCTAALVVSVPVSATEFVCAAVGASNPLRGPLPSFVTDDEGNLHVTTICIPVP